MDIIDVGSQARTGLPDLAPDQRLTDLRATLLGGRGPGASSEEVTEHTRNRPWLGAVPALVDARWSHARLSACEPVRRS